MQKKIVYIPLDERPCNYNFPRFLLEKSKDFMLVVPPLSIMGNKKTPANLIALNQFIIDETKDADGLIISIDTLLYGGIVPSRLHHDFLTTLNDRLSILKTVKTNNPKLTVFAFSLIMRTPQYSSDDEEPDYYEHCGYEIFKRGEIEHKIQLNIATQEEVNDLKIYQEKTKAVIDDFLTRRQINTDMNIETIKLVGSFIDYLVIPQDDSSVYGYIKRDQLKVKAFIINHCKENITIYPGADEVGLVLLARMINHFKKDGLKIYVDYASLRGAEVIPLYEDRVIHQTIKAQINSSGNTHVDNVLEADGILMVNTPIDAMKTPNMSNKLPHDQRDLVAFVNRTEQYLISKLVSIADVSIVNGGEAQLITLLEDRNLIYKLSGYSGWNTASNTIGTALSTLTYAKHYGLDESLKKFIALRVYEDIGYCGFVRKDVCEQDLPSLGLNYFDSGSVRGVVSNIVLNKINQYIQKTSPSTFNNYVITSCYMPWKRMFEVGLEINKKGAIK